MIEPATDDDMGRFVGFIRIGMLAILPLLLFVNRPDPLPPKTAMQGCFENPAAPSIIIDGRTIAFGGSRGFKMNYTLKRSKYGLLSVEPTGPVRLVIFEGEYRFSRADNGIIDFISLMHDVDGKGYAVLKPEDTEYLKVSVGWDHSLRFVRSPMSKCQST